MIDALLRGASLLACGGGLKFSEQKKLAQGKKFKLLSSADLDPGAWCATVSEVGAAEAPVMGKINLPAALKLLEIKTGKKIKALIPPEIGQEAIVIEAAHITNLPIVDSDLAGCRAVPRLSDLALVRQGVDFTMSPAVILNSAGKLVFIAKQPSLVADETRVRRLVPKKQVVTLVGGLVSGNIVKTKLNYQSYSLAIRLGKALKQELSLSQSLPTKLLFGPIKMVVEEIKALTSKGFDSKIVTISVAGKKGKLIVQNEYMNLKLGNRQFAFPQLIMVFDSNSKRGIHNSELVGGHSYDLVIAQAFNFWL